MDLALKDLEIINHNNYIDNYYKYILEHFNYLKTRSKYNELLLETYNNCYDNLNIFKNNKIKQLNVLSNLVHFIKSTKKYNKNRIDINYTNKELSNLKKQIKHLNKIINTIDYYLYNN